MSQQADTPQHDGEEQPFGPDGEGGASHYEIDPYGAAMSGICTALEQGFKHHGGMSEVEFGTLTLIAETVKKLDPAGTDALVAPIMKES